MASLLLLVGVLVVLVLCGARNVEDTFGQRGLRVTGEYHHNTVGDFLFPSRSVVLVPAGGATGAYTGSWWGASSASCVVWLCTWAILRTRASDLSWTNLRLCWSKMGAKAMSL